MGGPIEKLLLSGGGASIDLGITGASVGEVATVAAVDADGKPTAWETIGDPRPHDGTISLSATWTGEAEPWTQEVTVTGATVTARSAVTLCPTAAQLAQMIEDGVTALVIVNDAGTLTVSALGAPTSVAMTVACLVQETVEAAI